MRIICLILLCNLLFSNQVINYITDHTIIIEGMKFYLENNPTNAGCNYSLSCMSNILKTHGGWYCEKGVLMFFMSNNIYMWTNLFYSNDQVYSFNSNGILISIRRGQ